MKGRNSRDKMGFDALRQRNEYSRATRPVDLKNNRIPAQDKPWQQKAPGGLQKALRIVKSITASSKKAFARLNLSRNQKKAAILLVGVTVVGLAGLGVYNFVNKSDPSDDSDVLSENVLEPEFDTILPSGKTEETSDGKIGYDSKRKVASFRDKIGNTDITVSQQPLPDAFKANPDVEVKKIAEGFSATEVINESNPKAYLGIDVSGAQTVLFHKKGVLVFILSQKQIEKDQWAEYITKLL